MDRGDDEVLLARRLARGEREAAAELVDSTYRRIHGLLVRLCDGDVELAADLTQETYRKAWGALAAFDGRARVSTWLYRIAYNTFLNARRRPHVLVPLEDEHVATATNADPSPEQVAGTKQQASHVRRAVLGLPDELRFAVAARYWGELPLAEIALAEGVSAPAIGKRLKRALSMLADALAEV